MEGIAIVMGCTGSKELLVLPEDFYVDTMRDLIMREDHRNEQVDRLSSITFRVMKMYNNKELYSKDDRECLDALYMKVMEKQEKEEERRRRENSFRKKREEVMDEEREKLARMKRARRRNITW